MLDLEKFYIFIKTIDIKPNGKKRMLASSFVNGIKKDDYIGKVAYARKESE